MTMVENRRSVRTRTLYKGVIAFNNRSSTMNCVIKNLSAQGAKLVLGSPIGVPATFELAVAHKQRSYEARVVWRSGDEIGVVFADEQGTVEASPDATRELEALKAHNAALRRRVAELSQG